ncbi:MAG: serine/threonine protein kinase [Phycisphaerales bacterium]|nr:serine/threonine protein kinase [Phycisphaerales bacterium]
MIAPDPRPTDALLARLHGSQGRLTLREFLEGVSPDDALLAELIEVDGRFRLSRGEAIELESYLDAAPNLEQRPIALDAAIDMALRSLSGGSSPTPDAVETLVANYPALAGSIRDAAALGQAIWNTLDIAPAATGERTLPSDFGPVTASGARQYRLLRRLGDGASGDVFLAEDRLLSDDAHAAMAAIKILRLDRADPWSRRQAVEEAAKARRIDHPNVVRALNRGTTDQGEEYLVYEYVAGGDMSSPVFSGRLPMDPREAARLVGEVARGVQAAHSAGLVHCDLKPGNILLTREGVPKVADFGAATRHDDERRPGAPRRPVGTLAFMAPEQFRMEPGALAPPADVYALGGILFWLLTGRLANGSTRDEVVAAHMAGERRPAPSPREALPKIDADLDAICRRALDPDIRRRFSSPGQLADDLDAWRRREPIAWTKPSALRVAGLWIRRRPGVAAAILAVAALTVAGVWTAAHFRFESERARAAAAMADLRARPTRSYREVVGDKLRRDFQRLYDTSAAQPASDVLAAVLSLDSFMARDEVEGSHFLLLGAEFRARYAEFRRDDAIALGGADSFEAISWAMQGAFWRAHQGQTDAVTAALDNVEPAFHTRFGADDPIAAVFPALRAVVDANRIIEHGPSTDRLAACAVARRLEDSWTAVRRSIDAAPMQRLIGERLRTLYERCLIDHPAGEAYTDARLWFLGRSNRDVMIRFLGSPLSAPPR